MMHHLYVYGCLRSASRGPPLSLSTCFIESGSLPEPGSCILLVKLEGIKAQGSSLVCQCWS